MHHYLAKIFTSMPATEKQAKISQYLSTNIYMHDILTTINVVIMHVELSSLYKQRLYYFIQTVIVVKIKR